MRLAGKLEQAEGKAKFTEDKSHIETEEYKQLKEEYEAIDAQIKKKVDSIRHQSKFGTKLNAYDSDEEYEQRGPVDRMTQLRPNTRGRGDRDRRYQDGGDRRRNQSRRRDDRDNKETRDRRPRQ